MYAKCREYQNEETFPYIELNDTETVYYRPCDNTFYKCHQPDYWDDEEFNLIIMLDDRPIRAQSIEFDYFLQPAILE